MVISNRNLLFQGSIFRGHVSFREGNILNRIMEVWKMIFLFNWVIFRFQPFIFRGVGVLLFWWEQAWGLGQGPPLLYSLSFLLACGMFWLYIMRFKGNKKKRKGNLVINHHQPVNVDVTSLITHPSILPHPCLLVRVVLDVSETILLHTPVHHSFLAISVMEHGKRFKPI